MQQEDIVEAEFEEISKQTKTPKVNVGTIGHCNHGKSTFTDAITNISDADYTPAVPSDYTPEDDKSSLTRPEILEALKTAVSDGEVSPNEAKRMRRDMGIFGSVFTKKKKDPTKRKTKRNAQKKARKKQRK